MSFFLFNIYTANYCLPQLLIQINFSSHFSCFILFSLFRCVEWLPQNISSSWTMDARIYPYKLHRFSNMFYLTFQVEETVTGKCTETMERVTWDVMKFYGQKAQIKLVDDSSGGWGHINFDDLKGDMTCA